MNVVNYPNPFNESTTIEYTLIKKTHTEITVYNLVGIKIATLVDEYRNSGTHQFVWNAEGLSKGVYLLMFKTDDITQTIKMNLND